MVLAQFICRVEIRQRRFIELPAQCNRQFPNKVGPCCPPTILPYKLIYTVYGHVSRKAVEDAVRLSEAKYCSVAAMLKHTAKMTAEIRIQEQAAKR